ncbi:hypothetical protein ACFOKI_01345 [Sphingomonas qilianensis]|uniref:Hedgehog/Intein (Hint) domain-containing protein n=1 Tax=Sphingomonas qilianensis TaxID=1736690 RepID=A0ABU9XSE7_9SPHN
MEKKTVTLTTDQITIVRKHTAAVTSMLLGSRLLKPGTAITAGDQLDIAGRLQIAQVAREADADLVHLQFADTADGFCLSSIFIVMVRNGLCFGQPSCRLYLSKFGSRAVLLPQANVRGHFRLAPGEIIHVERKPDDVEAGIARAEAQVRKLVARGVCVAGQFEVTEIPLAA